MIRLMSVAVAAGLTISGLVSPAGQAGHAVAASGYWTGTWATATESGGDTFNQQTIRQIVHTSIGGAAARVDLSNTFGTAPLTLDDVHIAQAASGSAITAGTDHPVTFGGSASVTIPAGGTAASDPVSMAIPALADIAISFHVAGNTGPSTDHQLAMQTSYIASGDVSGASDLPGAQTQNTYYFLGGLDVQNPDSQGAVVALGASITDGYASSQDGNDRWTNVLASRLNAAGDTIGVLNAGISGNRLLADGSGPSAINRFARDVLGAAGVRWVIFSDDPINDLGSTSPQPSAAALIAGIQQLISAAHQNGISFICSTLTPYQGAGYWNSSGETAREAIDDFIRGPDSGCDGVVDQDTATHDPSAPTWYLPAYDSGDHLHPSDAGYQAIGNAVNLGLFTPPDVPVISLRAHADNDFVSAPDGGGSALIADATSVSPAEQFDEIDEGNGQIALRAHANGLVVTAEQAGAQPLIANRTAVGAWETFALIHNPDGSVSLKAAANGDYVTAEQAGAQPLIANRTAIGTWEEFDLVQDS